MVGISQSFVRAYPELLYSRACISARTSIVRRPRRHFRAYFLFSWVLFFLRLGGLEPLWGAAAGGSVAASDKGCNLRLREPVWLPGLPWAGPVVAGADDADAIGANK